MKVLSRRPWNLLGPWQLEQLMLEPWYPPFPLAERGLQSFGADAVDAVPDLELGLAEELVVGLGRQEPSDLAQLVVTGRVERLVEAVGGEFLLGGQRDLGGGHREALRERKTTQSAAMHRRPSLYGISHPLSRRSPPGHG